MLEHQKGLPDFWYRHSPLSMDPLKGPDYQYSAGARDMLAAIEAAGLVLAPREQLEAVFQEARIRRDMGAPMYPRQVIDTKVDWLQRVLAEAAWNG